MPREDFYAGADYPESGREKVSWDRRPHRGSVPGLRARLQHRAPGAACTTKRARTALSEVVDHIEAVGGRCVLVGGVISKHNQVTLIIREEAEYIGRLDGLINNAGSMLDRVPTLGSKEDREREVVTLNAHSVVWACQAAHPCKQGGVIINVTSITARHSNGGGSQIYAAAEGIVSTFTRGFAKEVIADGIRVNAVSPGTILTLFQERFSMQRSRRVWFRQYR